MNFIKDTTASALNNTADVLDDTADNIEERDGQTSTTGGKTTDDGNGQVTTKSSDENGISVRVNLSDGKNIYEAFYLKLPQEVSEQTLSTLRVLIAGSTDQKQYAALNFCSKKGAIVPDTYLIKEYLQECLENQPVKDNTVDMYLKKASEGPKMETPQSGPVYDASRLALLKQHFDETAFKLLTGTFYKYPADLEEKEWAAIAENNALCYGIRIVRQKQNGSMVAVGVERARYPAFRLKRRTILSERLASSTARDLEMFLRIPDYMVDDKSYVSVYETQSALQTSLASSSFSEFDVSASASGSFFGCSVGASASYGESSSKASTSTSSSSSKQVTIAYSFPRVSVFLDKRSVELTKDCQTALDKVNDKDALTAFLEDYGEFFALRAQLGGRLFATEQVDASSSSSSSDTARSMRAAAAASFSGFGASASVSAAHQSRSAQATADESSKSAMALTWQANGGDSLLCNNPTAWCSTVADFNYWRITKQDQGLHLVDFISKFPGYEQLQTKVTEWNTPKRPRKSSGFYLNGFDGYPDGRYLAADSLKFPLTKAVAAYNRDKGGYPMGYQPRIYGQDPAFLGPKNHKREFKELLWQVETVDGGNVCYETRYRMRHPTEGYLRFDWLMTSFLTMFPSKGHLILFRDAKGKQTEGKIADDAKIYLYFLSPDMDDLEEKFVYVACEDEDNAYLMIENSRDDKQKQKPCVFVFRYP
ncbi:putative MACPF domain-containing protein [Seiridium cardinale]|uniref:MACPF domain-containing protein n=1 Tax=Seiridium cardinale TaxID=138064 RepID=A0ABR2Y621_9PEZI